MCLILFNWKNHPRYDLILTANRDEFYNRPTLPAHFWKDNLGLFAGRDLQNGGTWMGITKSGRFAALTNHRDLSKISPNAPSRGALTSDFLTGEISPEVYLDNITHESKLYNGFNLLVGDNQSLWYFNNVNFKKQKINPGLYGLSNALLDDAWMKVEKGKKDLQKAIEEGDPQEEVLFKIMCNHEQAPDHRLPKTGLDFDNEKALSSIFIETAEYGTRCTTVLKKTQNEIIFSEKTFEIPGQKQGLVREVISH